LPFTFFNALPLGNQGKSYFNPHSALSAGRRRPGGWKPGIVPSLKGGICRKRMPGFDGRQAGISLHNPPRIYRIYLNFSVLLYIFFRLIDDEILLRISAHLFIFTNKRICSPSLRDGLRLSAGLTLYADTETVDVRTLEQPATAK
jgi:hypothetical protein